MILLEEAFSLIDKHVQPIPPTEIPIQDAVGCIVAEEVRSPIDVPPFDNSAMDGIALRSEDLRGNAPWFLPLDRVIAAGDVHDLELPHGHAVKIMTGAPLIKGADTVILIEEVELKDGNVRINAKPEAGQYIRPRGSDILKGDILFTTNEVLKPVDIGILASIGLTTVKVIPRPEIAIICTGSEIIDPGKPLQPGQIYNSNEASLQALLRNDGHTSVTVLPQVEDDVKAMSDILRMALESYQLVISNGAVSVGDFDYIPQVVRDMGGTTVFHKVKMQPGKPILLASFKQSAGQDHTDEGYQSNRESTDRWLVALQGYPVSAVVGYHLYVKRVLAKLMGITFKPVTTNARLASDIQVSGNQLKVIGVRLEETSQGWLAFPAKKLFFRLSSIKGIDGFVFIEGGERVLESGSEIKVELLYDNDSRFCVNYRSSDYSHPEEKK